MDQTEKLAKQLTDYLHSMEATLNITTDEKFKVDYKKTETAHRWTLMRRSVTNYYGFSHNHLKQTIQDYVVCKITLPIIDESQFVLKIIHDKGVKPKDCRDPQSILETLEAYLSLLYS